VQEPAKEPRRRRGGYIEIDDRVAGKKALREANEDLSSTLFLGLPFDLLFEVRVLSLSRLSLVRALVLNLRPFSLRRSRASSTSTTSSSSRARRAPSAASSSARAAARSGPPCASATGTSSPTA